MRIAIFGTGGAGGYFGAQLAHAGEDVVFIARGPHLQAIRTAGLRLDTPAGEIVIQPARVTDDHLLLAKPFRCNSLCESSSTQVSIKPGSLTSVRVLK